MVNFAVHSKGFKFQKTRAGSPGKRETSSSKKLSVSSQSQREELENFTIIIKNKKEDNLHTSWVPGSSYITCALRISDGCCSNVHCGVR